MLLLTQKISLSELQTMASGRFGNLVKGVVDVENSETRKKIVAIVDAWII